MSRFKAVIFDLDGVITDTAHYHYLAWKQLAESQGVHFDHEFNESLKGIDRMGSLDLILASAARKYTPEEKAGAGGQQEPALSGADLHHVGR